MVGICLKSFSLKFKSDEVGDEIVKFAGVDVGLRKSTTAVIEEGSAKIYEDYTMCKSMDILAVGIDAPLSFPESGKLRECEIELIRRGIRLFPSGSAFFRKVVEKGIEIADEFRKTGTKVFEVYPFATRKIIGIAPDCKKSRKPCLEKIKKELERYVDAKIKTHDDADAVISALTVKLFYEGMGELITGKDGTILVPRKEKI